MALADGGTKLVSVTEAVQCLCFLQSKTEQTTYAALGCRLKDIWKFQFLFKKLYFYYSWKMHVLSYNLVDSLSPLQEHIFNFMSFELESDLNFCFILLRDQLHIFVSSFFIDHIYYF